ncbi:hypothetical protein ACHQM5_029279 [Ranunculus cassubicifolius]
MIQTIEHIVLLKVKENTDSSKIKPMVDGLKNLSSIETVQHLTVGPVYKNSSQSSFTFTHILHSRYKSKEDLQTYLAHPDHLGLVKETISPICDDMMFLDWVADVEEPIVHPSPGAAMRVSFLKVKDGEKEKCLKVVEETRDGSGSISQYTYGEDFSVKRAKGFSIASIAIFPGLMELDSNEEVMQEQIDKVSDLVESIIVVDYVV